MFGDVNISAILDSFSVSYDKRVRPNYGGKYDSGFYNRSTLIKFKKYSTWFFWKKEVYIRIYKKNKNQNLAYRAHSALNVVWDMNVPIEEKGDILLLEGNYKDCEFEDVKRPTRGIT